MDIRTNYFRRQIKTLTWAGVALYDFRNDAIKRPYKIYSGILTVIFGVGYILSEVAHIVLNLDDVAVVTMTMCHFFAHCSGEFLLEQKYIASSGQFQGWESCLFFITIESPFDSVWSVWNETLF